MPITHLCHFGHFLWFRLHCKFANYTYNITLRSYYSQTPQSTHHPPAVLIIDTKLSGNVNTAQSGVGAHYCSRHGSLTDV